MPFRRGGHQAILGDGLHRTPLGCRRGFTDKDKIGIHSRTDSSPVAAGKILGGKRLRGEAIFHAYTTTLRLPFTSTVTVKAVAPA